MKKFHCIEDQYQDGQSAHAAAADDHKDSKNSPKLVALRAGLFITVGSVAGVIAFLDTVTASGVGNRVAALFILMAAAAAVWAGCLLKWRNASRWAGVGGGLACLSIAFTFGKTVFGDWWVEWSPSVTLAIAIMVGLAAVASMAVSGRYDSSESPLRPRKRVTRNVEIAVASIALVGTLLAAGLQMGGGWYTATHNPTQTSSNLTVAIDFGMKTSAGEFAVIPIQIRLKNGGQIGLDLPMTHYTVFGFDLAPRQADSDPLSPWNTLRDPDPQDHVDPFSPVAARTCQAVLQHGLVAETMTNLEPGEEKSMRVLVPIPGSTAESTDYDGIRVRVEAAATREEQFNMPDGEAPMYRTSSGQPLGPGPLTVENLREVESGGLYAAWLIERSTFMASMLAADREVRVGWRPMPDSESGSRDCPIRLSQSVDFRVVRPYVSFHHTAERSGEQITERYDPFYVYAVAERLVSEEGDAAIASPTTEGAGSPTAMSQATGSR